MKVAALSGGVGGAKLAEGLARTGADLTVIANTGDDFEHLGLSISPDIDSLVYALSGLADRERGWGRANESWNFMAAVGALGGETWFNLGDGDLAMHVVRSARLAAGEPLSAVTAGILRQLGVEARVLPATDRLLRTLVETESGQLAFQHYFVRERTAPRVTGFVFEGAETARPAPGALEALREADRIVICPSNPYISIDPILAVVGYRESVRDAVCVSPIVGGKAVKGPAAKMMAELGVEPSSLAIARHYRGMLRTLVIDEADAHEAEAIEAEGVRAIVAPTLMGGPADAERLARIVLEA